MADEVINAVQEAQPAADSQPAETKTTQDADNNQVADTGSDQDQGEVTQEASTEQVKPTRSEKRIKDLARKLAEAKKTNEPHYGYEWPSPQLTPSEDGTLTPEQLDQYVAAKANQIVEMRLAADGQQREYQQQVESYLADMETTALSIEQDFKDSPELAAKVNELLTDINKRTNLDDSGKLVPRIKTSELYKQLKDALTLTRQTGKVETEAKLAQQIAEGAITPSTKEVQKTDYSKLSTQDIWKNPSEVRQALRAKLPVSQD